MRLIACYYRMNNFGGSNQGLFGFLQEIKTQNISIRELANDDEKIISMAF